MKYSFIFIFIVIICNVITTSSLNDDSLHHPTTEEAAETECKDDDEACLQNKQSFLAVAELHDQLDDDKDGEVDPEEADEFVRDELKYTDGFERTKTMHRNDKHISKFELWKSWKQSQAFNWTTEDIVQWLTFHVKLGQYADRVRDCQLKGSDLPKLAVSNMNFITNRLRIKNNVHKQKLYLKAMDLVLFGPPNLVHNPWKDLGVIVTFLGLAGGFWYAMVQNRYSKRHIARMNLELEQLTKAEHALKELQAKLDTAGGFLDPSSEHHSEDAKTPDHLPDEFRLLQEELRDAKHQILRQQVQMKRLLQKDPSGAALSSNMAELQLMLQFTCELERQYLNVQRTAVHTQLMTVKEEQLKLTKKKSGFVGSLRLDVSGSMQQMESKISDLCDVINKVNQDFNEHRLRWSRLEVLTNLTLLKNAGLKTLQTAMSEMRSSSSSPNLHSGSNLMKSMNNNNIPPAAERMTSMFGGSSDGDLDVDWSTADVDRHVRSSSSNERMEQLGVENVSPVMAPERESSSEEVPVCPPRVGSFGMVRSSELPVASNATTAASHLRSTVIASRFATATHHADRGGGGGLLGYGSHALDVTASTTALNRHPMVASGLFRMSKAESQILPTSPPLMQQQASSSSSSSHRKTAKCSESHHRQLSGENHHHQEMHRDLSEEVLLSNDNGGGGRPTFSLKTSTSLDQDRQNQGKHENAYQRSATISAPNGGGSTLAVEVTGKSGRRSPRLMKMRLPIFQRKKA